MQGVRVWASCCAVMPAAPRAPSGAGTRGRQYRVAPNISSLLPSQGCSHLEGRAASGGPHRQHAKAEVRTMGSLLRSDAGGQLDGKAPSPRWSTLLASPSWPCSATPAWAPEEEACSWPMLPAWALCCPEDVLATSATQQVPACQPLPTSLLLCLAELLMAESTSRAQIGTLSLPVFT